MNDRWALGWARGAVRWSKYLVDINLSIEKTEEAAGRTTTNWDGYDVSPWLSRHPFSQYSPTGSTWLMYGGEIHPPGYVLRLETYCGLQRR